MQWSAIVVAAGRGSRFGRPKQLVELAGAPLVSWCLRTFAKMQEVVQILVVTEEPWLGAMREIVAQLVDEKRFDVIAGGETRQESVANGLREIGADCEAVLVHDGARPLVRATDVRNAMRVVRDGHAAVLGIPVVDTIKTIDPKTRLVSRTLDRSTLWAAQTPQLATVYDLRRAHSQAEREGLSGTDEAVLLERIGVAVEMVPGSSENFKVTVPHDLARAEQLMQERLQHVPGEEEVVLVEVFVHENLVDAVCRELQTRGGTIDAVERDLPTGAAVRAFVRAEAMEGFGERFEAFATGEGTYTTHFSHYAGKAEPV